MKFIGTVFMVIVVFGAAFLIPASLMQDIFWPALILSAVILAIAIHMYPELDERLERIEQRLGIGEEPEKSFSEQLKEDR